MMNWQKFLPPLKFGNFILCPALVIFLELLPLPLLSQPGVQVSIKFPPTVDRRSVPTSTAGGGTRRGLSSCTQQSKAPLTALMPSNHVGTTVAASPTFFLYVPKTTAESSSVEFLLVDEQENEVYQTTLTLTGTPGIINLSLPKTTSLKVGKTYHWQFTLNCDPEDPDNEEFEFVEGLIKRTQLSPYLKTKIVLAPPLEQAQLYANMGIWHETVTILSVLRSSRPNEWEELMKSVGLDAIASAPFVKCCTAEN